MSPDTRITSDEVRYVTHGSRNGRAGLAVFIHGYLDNATVWERLFGYLNYFGWALAAVDLHADGREETGAGLALEGYRDQVLQVIRELDDGMARPLVIIGHSMGGQIAELAALCRQDLSGLVLITPTPLVGYPLPDQLMEAFRQRIGNRDRAAIAHGKRALAVNLDASGLDTLVNATACTAAETAEQQLRAWTGGHPAGADPSQVKAPTLIVSTDDTVFPRDFLATDVAPRFENATLAEVPDSGHWPQIEQPARLASVLAGFLARLT
jgi:pimeloyl-ACP methyl ester carboxylesterase